MHCRGCPVPAGAVQLGVTKSPFVLSDLKYPLPPIKEDLFAAEQECDVASRQTRRPSAWARFGGERFGLKTSFTSGAVLRFARWPALDEHKLIHELVADSGPSPCGFTAAKYSESRIFISGCCTPKLGSFQGSFGSSTRDERGPTC